MDLKTLLHVPLAGAEEVLVGVGREPRHLSVAVAGRVVTVPLLVQLVLDLSLLGRQGVALLLTAMDEA